MRSPFGRMTNGALALREGKNPADQCGSTKANELPPETRHFKTDCLPVTSPSPARPGGEATNPRFFSSILPHQRLKHTNVLLSRGPPRWLASFWLPFQTRGSGNSWKSGPSASKARSLRVYVATFPSRTAHFRRQRNRKPKCMGQKTRNSQIPTEMVFPKSFKSSELIFRFGPRFFRLPPKGIFVFPVFVPKNRRVFCLAIPFPRPQGPWP